MALNLRFELVRKSNNNLNWKLFLFFSAIQSKIIGNTHDIVSCRLYWIHLVACECSILCCITKRQVVIMTLNLRFELVRKTYKVLIVFFSTIQLKIIGQFTRHCIVYFVFCEHSILCCIVYFAFQMYFFGIETIWYPKTNVTFEKDMKTYIHYFIQFNSVKRI